MSADNLILRVDTKDRYVELRNGQVGYVLSTTHDVRHRPDLDHMRKVNGDLDFIFKEIHEKKNPRIVVEAKDRGVYQVIYRWGDKETINTIAKHFDLDVTEHLREVPALALRTSKNGPRLTRAEAGKVIENVEKIACDQNCRWPLDGITMDKLARFLETRYSCPVVNMTGIDGNWRIYLSLDATKSIPPEGSSESVSLDDLGLELRWEQIKIPVTLIKDKR